MKTIGTVALLVGTFFGPAAPAEDLMAMDPAVFARQPALTTRLTADSLDCNLLAAAIFHETNRVRREAGLPALQWLKKLNEAAEIQSHIGAVFRPPSHTNPFAAISTPSDRVRFAGLVPRYVAENIALLSLYDVSPDSGVGVSRLAGKTTYVDLATGHELTAHTYASYATMVVQAWMNSPGHRKNILDPAVQCLGCSVYPRRGDYGGETVFSVQVFYAPLGKRPPEAPEPVRRMPDGWLAKIQGG